MTPDIRRCPKCDGTMQLGFLPDASYGTTTVSTWYPGKAQKSFWQGTKIDREDSITVDAFRCERCGFVELYARAAGPAG